MCLSAARSDVSALSPPTGPNMTSYRVQLPLEGPRSITPLSRRFPPPPPPFYLSRHLSSHLWADVQKCRNVTEMSHFKKKKIPEMKRGSSARQEAEASRGRPPGVVHSECGLGRCRSGSLKTRPSFEISAQLLKKRHSRVAEENEKKNEALIQNGSRGDVAERESASSTYFTSAATFS